LKDSVNSPQEVKGIIKQVKTSKNNTQNFLLVHQDELEQGTNPSSLRRKHPNKFKSVQAIKYYFDKLRKQGLLKKIGYGTYVLTNKGIVTTKKLIRTTRKTSKTYSIWRLGYRFLIKYKGKSLKLKPIKGMRGKPKISQGHILDCWVRETKDLIEIYCPIEQRDDIWDAAIRAAIRIWTCHNFIVKNYHYSLIPLERIVPDIIINTPEAKQKAKEIFESVGRMRTQTTEIDQSKTGKPEYEVHTPEQAENVVENLALGNQRQDIMSELQSIRQITMGNAGTINMLSQTQNMIVIAVKDIKEILKRMNGQVIQDGWQIWKQMKKNKK